MKKRKLGRTDIEVSPLAFGGNVFGCAGCPRF